MLVQENSGSKHILSTYKRVFKVSFSFVYYFFPKLYQEKFNFLVDFCRFHLQCTANFKRCIIVFYFSFFYHILAVPLCITRRHSSVSWFIAFFYLRPYVSSLSQSVLKIMLQVTLTLNIKVGEKTFLWFLSTADGKLKPFCLLVGRFFWNPLNVAGNTDLYYKYW